MINKVYAGIGSRSTPPDILPLMTEIAMHFDQWQWTLRSGGATGADSAFEAGVTSDRKEIYIPWKGFNGSSSILYWGHPLLSPKAELVAARCWKDRESRGEVGCPWHRLRTNTMILMARNMYQVFGARLDIPCDMIICWTPEGKVIGGTAQALNAAFIFRKKHNVSSPIIINLGFSVSVDRIKKMLRNNEDPSALLTGK